MNKLIGLLVILFCSLASSLTLFADMKSYNYSINTSVLSSGGTHGGSTNYEIESTLGQSSPLLDPSDPPLSTNYDLYPGFWYTIGAFGVTCPGDFNGDGDVDGVDLADYIFDYGGLGLDVFAANFGKKNCP